MTRRRGGGFTSGERLVLTGGIVAATLVPLNSTMIAVALPDVAADLGVAPPTAAWLVTTYLVAMGLCQPVAGRLGDRVGARRVALVALAGFGAAALLAAAAVSFVALLGARVLQAVFGAALIPNLQAIARVAIADERRGRAFGIFAAGAGAGAAAGPVLGGILVDAESWRSTFLVNVPVVVVAIVLLARIAEVRASPAAADLTSRPLRQRPFLAACAANATGNLTMYTVLLVVPLVLATRDWSSSATGLVLLGLTAGMFVLSPVGGSLGDRHGRRPPVVTGLGVVTVGAAVLTVGVSTPVAIVAAVVLVGIGMGISGASLQAAALESVPPDVTGSAAGVFSTSRYLGSITGSLAIAVLAADGTGGTRVVLALATAAALVAVAAATRIAERPAPLAPPPTPPVL